MGDKHVVRFEPVGIEIEVDEEQTVLRAAFDQGLMLMHGCKEGQCSACKSFLLEGDDVELDKYSTFALPDFEREEGFTLLCRAHVYEDVTIELLNYDEEMIRSGLPIQEVETEVVANDPVTHDLRHLVLRLVSPDIDFKFFPGQYVDISVPGTDEVRSFSMANTSARESGQLEFVIKVYPDGLFSDYLDKQLKVGDRLTVTGPYGVFMLRDAPDTDLIFVGGGAGMAPILSPAPLDGRTRYRPQGRVLLRRAPPRRPVFRGRAPRPGADPAQLPVRARPVGRGLGGRERPDHRRGVSFGASAGPGARLHLRSPAHGGGRGPAADQARGTGKARVFRQVHDHWGPGQSTASSLT